MSVLSAMSAMSTSNIRTSSRERLVSPPPISSVKKTFEKPLKKPLDRLPKVRNNTLDEKTIAQFHTHVDIYLKTKNVNELRILESILQKTPKVVNSLDPKTAKTALEKATISGNKFATALLLSRGASTEETITLFHTYLDIYLTTKNVNELRTLERILNNHPSVINSLDPETSTTALKKAILFGDRYAVSFLLSRGASNIVEESNTKSTHRHQHSAFCYSLQRYNTFLALLILRFHRDPYCCKQVSEYAWNAITSTSTANLKLLSYFDCFTKKQYRQQYLCYASLENRADVVDYYSRNGGLEELSEKMSADSFYLGSSIKERIGRIFLLAATFGSSGIIEYCSKMFGEDQELNPILFKDKNGATALHHAKAGNHDDLCQSLIAKKANPLAMTSSSPFLPKEARNATYIVYAEVMKRERRMTFQRLNPQQDPDFFILLSEERRIRKEITTPRIEIISDEAFGKLQEEQEG